MKESSTARASMTSADRISLSSMVVGTLMTAMTFGRGPARDGLDAAQGVFVLLLVVGWTAIASRSWLTEATKSAVVHRLSVRRS